MEYLRLFLKAATQPLIMFGVVCSLYFIWLQFGGTTDDTALIKKVETLFTDYGLLVALVSSFLEVLLLIGWYFPGSVVIFISVILADSWLEVVYAVCAVSVGMQAGYLANFYIGKYGWYTLLLRFGLRETIEDTKKRLEQYGPRFLVFTYWHPGLGSVSATVCGILQFPLRYFFVLSLLSVLVWNIFWGIVVYIVGEQSLTLFFSWQFVVGALCIWTAVRFLLLVYERRVAA